MAQWAGGPAVCAQIRKRTHTPYYAKMIAERFSCDSLVSSIGPRRTAAHVAQPLSTRHPRRQTVTAPQHTATRSTSAPTAAAPTGRSRRRASRSARPTARRASAPAPILARASADSPTRTLACCVPTRASAPLYVRAPPLRLRRSRRQPQRRRWRRRRWRRQRPTPSPRAARHLLRVCRPPSTCTMDPSSCGVSDASRCCAADPQPSQPLLAAATVLLTLTLTLDPLLPLSLWRPPCALPPP